MTDVAEVLLFVTVVLWIGGFLAFVVETRRLPGTHVRWSVYQVGRSFENYIEIGVRRRSERVKTDTVRLSSPTFDEDLIKALGEAREKAIVLNAHRKMITRRLP